MGILEEYERGRLFFDYGDYITAARILEPVVEEAPDDVAPRLLLARAYYHSAQLKKSETQLRLILDHDPAEHYAHLMLGRCLQRQSRHDEARPHMRIAAAMGI
ncbi:tetratricopeptide repeat protein [Catellatospora sp. NPDC049609]|uniref:tetratricopeptide repeat protein n=1 Tax=Catellatospora sp. NPDC049609 TaxID=3155505 RepID=UPI0034378339